MNEDKTVDLMQEMRIQSVYLRLAGEHIETLKEMAGALGITVLDLMQSVIAEAAREYRENLKDAQYNAAIWLMHPDLQEKIRKGAELSTPFDEVER